MTCYGCHTARQGRGLAWSHTVSPRLQFLLYEGPSILLNLSFLIGQDGQLAVLPQSCQEKLKGPDWKHPA